jgi:subtilisin family serine protease
VLGESVLRKGWRGTAGTVAATIAAIGLVSGSATAAEPADPGFPWQWGLRNTGQELHGQAGLAGADVAALDAWSLAPSPDAVTVAVVDTGVRPEHPDLAGRVVFPRPFEGVDQVGHGTHVAGIIAAAADDGGIVGLARGVRIMSLRVLDPSGLGDRYELAQALDYAGDQGVRVVNVSVTGFADLAVREAIATHPDTLYVVAAGNDGRDLRTDPRTSICTLPFQNLLCVTATDPRDQLPWWADRGAPSVDIAAPGVDILSDYVHADTLLHDDFRDPAAWRRDPGWEMGDGVLRLTGEAGTGDIRTATSVATFDQPLRRACRVELDVRARMQGEGNVHALFLDDPSSDRGWRAAIPAVYDGRLAVDIPLREAGDGSGPTRTVILAADPGLRARPEDRLRISRLEIRCFDPSAPARAGDVAEETGTSMAAPFVSATAALLLARDPTATTGELVSRIRCGVDPLPALDGATLAGGRLDAAGALRARLAPAPPRFSALVHPITATETRRHEQDTTDLANASTTPYAMAVEPDGDLVFSDRDGANVRGWRIRRLTTAGAIETIAGPGTPQTDGRDEPAATANVGAVGELAIGPDGAIWFVGANAIRRIDPDGMVRTLAGGRNPAGDGTPDGQSAVGDGTLDHPRSILPQPDGSVLFVEDDPVRVRRVAADGTVSTIAGGGSVPAGDGVAARDARFGMVRTIARAPDGALLIGERQDSPNGASTIHRLEGGVLRPWIRMRAGFGGGGEGGPLERSWGTLSRFWLDGDRVLFVNAMRQLAAVRPGGTVEPVFGSGLWLDRPLPAGDAPATESPIGGDLTSIAVGARGIYIGDESEDQISLVGRERVPVPPLPPPCAKDAGPGGGEAQPADGGDAAGTGAPPMPGPAAPPAEAGTTGEAPAASATPPTGAPLRAVAAPLRRVAVRVTKHVRPAGAGRVRVTLTVTTARGATVTVRCRGRGCPARARRLVARGSRMRVTFARVQRGARIEIVVTAPGRAVRTMRLTAR